MAFGNILLELAREFSENGMHAMHAQEALPAAHSALREGSHAPRCADRGVRVHHVGHARALASAPFSVWCVVESAAGRGL